MPQKKESLTEKDLLRIKIKAYDTKLIDEASKKIVEAGLRANVQVVGPIPLPTKKSRLTVKDKTQQRGNPTFANFERRVHKRLIDLLNPNDKVMEAMSGLNLPAGVGVEMIT